MPFWGWIIIGLVILVLFIRGNNPANKQTPQGGTDKTTKSFQSAEYKRKARLLTFPEQEFFEKLKKAVDPDYLIYPQIVLSSVIEKAGDGYQSELSRVCDFGIFDKDFSIVALIEYNDISHHTDRERIDRDGKVRYLCDGAGIPLITFWTQDAQGKSFANDINYIRSRINSFVA
ncbi:MAG: DUF2726 domain-containing protein [Clostridiales bacterium]|jgi:hypothetical protein|nr:DUF2726 domain-containing protein [Clostridiales bacterium]